MNLIDHIRERLAKPLPGFDAHRVFVPDMPESALRLAPPPADARRSAVLVPLIAEVIDDLRIVFTVRSESLRSHKGQISFPGGRIDEGEDVYTAALRELHEEIGVEPHDVTILGELTPLYIPPSNSAVTPVVALIKKTRAWVISEAEVTEVLDIPFASFLDATSISFTKQSLYGRLVDVPQWSIHPSVPLWGATAMILNELVWIVNDYIKEYR